MAKIDTKNLVLHGVGEAFLLSGDGKVSAKLGSLQDMTIEVTATMEDVFGGDGLFPIYNYIKEKSASFKFKNACFESLRLPFQRELHLFSHQASLSSGTRGCSWLRYSLRQSFGIVSGACAHKGLPIFVYATELRLFVGWRIIVIYHYHVIVSSFLAMQILPKAYSHSSSHSFPHPRNSNARFETRHTSQLNALHYQVQPLIP